MVNLEVSASGVNDVLDRSLEFIIDPDTDMILSEGPGALTVSNGDGTIFSRRYFIQSVAAAATTSVLPAIGVKAEEFTWNPKVYDTTSLKGLKLGGLATSYTGINGRVGDTVAVDFRQLLDNMWKKKMSISKGAEVNRFYETRVKEYLNPKFTPIRMNFVQYLTQVKEAIELVRSSLDWRKVGAIKGLDERRLRLVQNISYYLGEREVMAYSLTELCPSSNGRANVKLIDFLLRNAGREYVELLPALGDKLLSYGPKQWTKWAVYEGKGGPRGASIIDQAMPQTIDLPGSVAELRGNQHFMASMEFIINNLAYTIKDLDEKSLATLESSWKNVQPDIVQYIAVSHHAPRYGKEFMTDWLARKTINGKARFLDSCCDRFTIYAQKTAANHGALSEGIVKSEPTSQRYQPKEAQKQAAAATTDTQSTAGRTDRSCAAGNAHNVQSNGPMFARIGSGKYCQGWDTYRYIVQEGDTPLGIASRFNRSVWGYKPVGYANIKSPDDMFKGHYLKQLRSGQTINIVAKNLN
ncbi:MAG TPA: hypothetical protein VFF28_00695 [Candidatus Nanoarchaeia archaeon]|nr:hypothetical protein [Candidatus Nanoarchaeia archaeon]